MNDLIPFIQLILPSHRFFVFNSFFQTGFQIVTILPKITQYTSLLALLLKSSDGTFNGFVFTKYYLYHSTSHPFSPCFNRIVLCC